VKLLAFITTAAGMFLGSYLLRSLHRRLGLVLDKWRGEPVERWSVALPTSPK
jgi:hypothetical protein